MKKIEVTLKVNGQSLVTTASGSRSLLSLLHEEPGLEKRGTKFGCGIGECRACTVVVHDAEAGHLRALQSCMTPLRHCKDQEIYTIESVAGTEYARVQKEFTQNFAFQCGYCAPGFIMSTIALLDQLRAKPVARDQLHPFILDALGENYCRCTGYTKYYASVVRLAEATLAESGAGARMRAATSSPPAEAFTVPQNEFHVVANAALDDAVPVVRLAERPALAVASSPFPSPLPQPYFHTAAQPSARAFASAHLELIRLLRSAAEIEHSLMVQYLYAVFSVKLPRYAMLAGWSTHRHGGPPNSLLGVAVEEMVHLYSVNQLLVALGARPNLGRQQFPLEVDIYPFPVNLEALNPNSLAKYVYIEAPEGAIDPNGGDAISEVVNRSLNRYPRLNPVGSIYTRIVDTLNELEASGHYRDLDYAHWRDELAKIKGEGEGGHFEIFRDILLGTHPALSGIDKPWELPPHHQDYPSYQLPANPSAFEASEGAILSPQFRKVAWLSNLYYWLVCMALDWSHMHDGRLLQAARRIMVGPIRCIGQFLAEKGIGMPFDTLPMTYSPGLTDADRLHLMDEMCEEVASCEREVLRYLPEDYPLDSIKSFVQEMKANSPQITLREAKGMSSKSAL